MSRIIKFRVYSTIREPKMMYLPTDGSFSGRDLIENEQWKIMQFTGLKDKNRVEIFEGDIVKAPACCIKDNHEVFFNTHAYPAYYIRHKDGTSTGFMHTTEGEFACEVIGNVHENPELLSVTNDKAKE